MGFIKKTDVMQLGGTVKNKKKWPVVVGVIVALFIIGSAFGGNEDQQPSATNQQQAASREQSQQTGSEVENTASPAPTLEETKAKAKELDAQIYDIILRSEKVTSLLRQGMTLTSEGQASLLDLYDLAKQAEESQQSLYGALMDLSDDTATKYTNAAEYYVSNAKSVATDLRKYIDKQEMKYLSSAKESLGKTEGHTYNVLAERMSYLTSQGFTDTEVANILGAGTTAQ